MNLVVTKFQENSLPIKKTLNQKLNQCDVHWKAFVCVVVWSIRHVLKIESERESQKRGLWRNMERKNTFIKIHCVKIILMFVFSWAFNQSRVRALYVLSMYVSIHFWPFFIITLCTFEHDFESNTHTRDTLACMQCVYIDWFGGT